MADIRKTDVRPDEDSVTPADIANAMAVYSADGQVDDETGGDAAAEQMRATQDLDDEEVGPERPGRTGPV